MSKAKPQTETDDISLRDISDFIFRRKYFFICAAIFACIGGIAQRSHRPRFVTSAVVQLSKTEGNPAQALNEKLGVFGGGNGSASNEVMENTKSYFVAEETYRQVARKILAHPNAKEIEKDLRIQATSLVSRLIGSASRAYEGEARAAALASYLVDASGAEITSQETIRVWVRGDSAVTTIVVVNLIAETAVQAINENSVREFNQTKKFVQGKLDNLQTEIKGEQKELVEIAKKMGLVLGSDLRTNSNPINRLRDELADAENEQTQRTKLIEELKQRFTKGQTGFDTVTKYEKLLDENKYWLAVVQSRRGALKNLEDKQKNSPNYEQDFQNKTRQIEFKYRFYGELTNQLLQIEMMEISVGNKVRVLEAGSEGNTLVSTKGVGFLITGLFSALLAMIITGVGLYIMESIHPTVNNRRDLETLPMSYLGEIPDFELDRFKLLLSLHKDQAVGNNHLLWHQQQEGKLIESPETMIFKNVRSRLLHMQSDGGAKAQLFCVTSARPGEGKSMISGNLASVVSVLKKKILLIDGDLRCGGLTSSFGMSGKPGLSNFLHDKTNDWKKFVERHPLGIDVIPRGTECHNIVEIYSEEKFKTWLAKMRKEYDYIIIDMSPVLAVPETAIVCKHADLVLMVVTQHVTRIEEVKHAVEDLSFGETRQVGYVLNRCGALSKDTYFYGMSRAS